MISEREKRQARAEAMQARAGKGASPHAPHIRGGAAVPGSDAVPMGFPHMTKEALRERLGEIMILDARSPQEATEMSIPGSLNERDLDADYQRSLSRQRTYVVYSGSGDDELTRRLASRITELGFDKVYVLQGGWADWEASGFPMEVRQRGEEPSAPEIPADTERPGALPEPASDETTG